MLKPRKDKNTNRELREKVDSNMYGLFITRGGVSQMYSTYKNTNEAFETMKTLIDSGLYKDAKFEMVILPMKDVK